MKKFCELKWKAFKIDEIFNISSGKRLTKECMKEGDTPFVGSTDSNNGITAFCGNENESVDSNVLGVNYNGSVVENFYHPYKALFSDDVKRLHLKEVNNNLYVCLFIKVSILQQKKKLNMAINLMDIEWKNNTSFSQLHLTVPPTMPIWRSTCAA